MIEAIGAGKVTKPIVAWCTGTCAQQFSTDVQFGHAGACAHADQETADAKNSAMRTAGIYVPHSFDTLGEAIRYLSRHVCIEYMSDTVYSWVESPTVSGKSRSVIIFCVVVFSELYQKLRASGVIVEREEVPPPTVPMDYDWARELGLIRKPASFMTSIVDERGNDVLYAGIPISEVISKDLGIGGVLSLLWFQRLCVFVSLHLSLSLSPPPPLSLSLSPSPSPSLSLVFSTCLIASASYWLVILLT